MVQTNNLKKVIVIGGPTASGKSALAVAVAKRLDTEIISADSLIVYKNLNIGTAKPTIEEMCGVKHHLIDVVSPLDAFSVSDYRERATTIIDELHKIGKIPVICGGTGFYINSLLFDLSYGKTAQDEKIREKYSKIAEEKGNEYLHSLLKEIDPISANEIHFNNVKRVIRAIEIYELSGTKKSDICDGYKKLYDYKAYAINFDRKILYERINKRVDKMFNDGLLDEIKSILSLGVTENSQSMQGIGYREFFPYFKGEISLEEVKENIKLNTRHYAKRQETYFKKLDGINYLDPNKIESLVDVIINNI